VKTKTYSSAMKSSYFLAVAVTISLVILSLICPGHALESQISYLEPYVLLLPEHLIALFPMDNDTFSYMPSIESRLVSLTCTTCCC
jgi:hypothetical protein